MQILTQRGGYITVHSVLSNTYYGLWMQILLERYAYSEIGGTFILI